MVAFEMRQRVRNGFEEPLLRNAPLTVALRREEPPNVGIVRPSALVEELPRLFEGEAFPLGDQPDGEDR